MKYVLCLLPWMLACAHDHRTIETSAGNVQITLPEESLDSTTLDGVAEIEFPPELESYRKGKKSWVVLLDLDGDSEGDWLLYDPTPGATPTKVFSSFRYKAGKNEMTEPKVIKQAESIRAFEKLTVRENLMVQDLIRSAFYHDPKANMPVNGTINFKEPAGN
jgi:hypothetical protein